MTENITTETLDSTTNPIPATETKAEPWFNSLSEDLKTNPNITKYNSVEDLANANINLVSKLGTKSVELPKSVDEYKYSLPENVREEFKGDLIDPNIESIIKEVGLESGLPAETFNKIMSAVADKTNSIFEDQITQRDKEYAEFDEKTIQELGQDKYDQLNNDFDKVIKDHNISEQTLNAMQNMPPKSKLEMMQTLVATAPAEGSLSVKGEAPQSRIEEINKRITEIDLDPKLTSTHWSNEGFKLGQEKADLWNELAGLEQQRRTI
jgi:hypothetical protein